MTLRKILAQNMPPEMVELYHVVEYSDTPEDMAGSLASFKKNGAVAQTTSRCNWGQSNGFFVWTNKEKAFEHSEFQGGLSHLMLIFKMPKAEVKYPDWSIDFEAVSVGPFLKRHEEEVKNLGKIECTHYDMWGEDPLDDVISVQSISDEDGSIKVVSQKRGEIVLEQRRDLGEIEAIFMKMVETSPQFLTEYNTAMQKLMQPGRKGALKYQGKNPLPISAASIIEHVYSNHESSCKEIPIYESQNKEQVCPFLLGAKEINRIRNATKKGMGHI